MANTQEIQEIPIEAPVAATINSEETINYSLNNSEAEQTITEKNNAGVRREAKTRR